MTPEQYKAIEDLARTANRQLEKLWKLFDLLARWNRETAEKATRDRETNILATLPEEERKVAAHCGLCYRRVLDAHPST
jgi:hypothetical protein